MSRSAIALLAAMAAIALSTEASAQAPSCYVQGLVASSITTAKASDAGGPITVAARGLDGAIGAGCDVHLAPRIVVGALARWVVPDVKSSLGSSTLSTDTSWQGAARLGLVLEGGTLVYGLAGWTGTGIKLGDTHIKSDGVLFGAGIDIAISGPISLTVEWTRANPGTWTDQASGLHVAPSTDAARAGITYRFGHISQAATPSLAP